MKTMFRRATLGLVAVVFLVIGLVVASQLSLTPSIKAGPSNLWTDGVTTPKADRPGSFADLAEKQGPAVVNISTATVIKSNGNGTQMQNPFGENNPFRDFFGDEFFKRFFGGPKGHQFKKRALGSGFVITKDGYIVTNNHVVDDADEIVVILAGGDEYPAKVIGKDKKTDIALIKIKPKKDLPICRLGDSDAMRVGDWVVAIGNPFGLGHTVTAGIISAKGRELGAGPYDDFIQTDAAINPGNSGGPLFDTSGNVIGINSAIYTRSGGNQGIGFAIPINLVKSIVSQLKDNGKVTRAWLGVLIQQITPEIQKGLDLKSRKGALVADVVKDGPADKAGIKRGDVIIRFNDQKVESQHELPTMVAYLPVGGKVDLVALRHGKKMTFHLVLEEMKPENEVVGAGEPDKSLQTNLGLTLQNVTPAIAERLGLKAAEGVVITSVEPDSPAKDAGLRRGDVILEVNRKKVENVDGLNGLIEKAKDKDSILFLINRAGRTIFIALKK